MQETGTAASQGHSRSTSGQRSLLIFRVGVAWMAVDAHSVDEVAELGVVTPLPKIPAYLPGLLFLRGHAVPLLDLARFLEIAPLPESDEDRRPTRVVVISHEGMRIGVASDQVRGVMHRREAELKPAETLPDPLRTYSEAQIQDHDDLIAVLHLDHLLQEARPQAVRS